jgi:predicted lipid-binding transport protein (Tim44 family)
MFRHRWLIALAAIATSLVLVSADADARAGRSSSAGSRGSHTYSAPPSTNTAPTAAAPINRSMTQPGSTVGAGAGAAAAAKPGLLGGGLFGGGLLGGLAAGFIGAGLFGMLFGHGAFGGMGGFASILGLVLQVVLVVIVARLIFAWWQRRQSPQTAYASANANPANNAGATSQNFAGLGGMFGGGNAAPASAPVTIEKEDYDAFERLLEDVQAAYSAEDLNALRREVTPEMLSYFSEDLADNASRGVVNRVTDVKLLQGDLSEAWNEGNVDYATVAMHFALTDTLVERASGKTVEGGSPSEVTELWTFMRSRGGNWLLSAIQQA